MSNSTQSTAVRTGIAIVILHLAAAATYGQILYGSLTGRVTDPSGGAVSTVEVTATNKQTGAVREAKADAACSGEVILICPLPS